MSENDEINTLLVATVLGGQAGLLTQIMREKGFRFTEVDSRLGFVQEPVTSLLVGLNRSELDNLLKLVRQYCPARLEYIPARLDASALQGQPLMIEALLGGATLFVFEVEQFIQL